MKIYSVKCPDCNATLNIEEGREYCFCTYCGSKIFIDDGRTQRIRITDDAKLKRIEAAERIKIEQMKKEERDLEWQRKQFPKIMIGLGIAFIVLWILLFMIDK